ncbi:MAG: ammonia channel protein, partial [Actinomycetes bacterium]
RQAIAAGAVMVYSFITAAIIGLAIHKTMGFRISRDDELAGIDLTAHAETAYELNEATFGGSFSKAGSAAAGAGTGGPTSTTDRVKEGAPA